MLLIVLNDYLKLNINNVNCLGANDSMRFHSSHGPEEWDSWSTYRIGCYTLTSPDYFQISGGWTIYETEITRINIITYQRDSIFLNDAEYGEIFVNY